MPRNPKARRSMPLSDVIAKPDGGVRGPGRRRESLETPADRGHVCPGAVPDGGRGRGTSVVGAYRVSIHRSSFTYPSSCSIGPCV